MLTPKKIDPALLGVLKRSVMAGIATADIVDLVCHIMFVEDELAKKDELLKSFKVGKGFADGN